MQKPNKGINILYVDSDEESQIYVKKLLGHEGYSIIIASGIISGLIYLSMKDIDLIIIDHIMPTFKVDEIVSLAETLRIPVIFYTSDNEKTSNKYRIIKKSHGIQDLLQAINATMSNVLVCGKTIRFNYALKHIKS